MFASPNEVLMLVRKRAEPARRILASLTPRGAKGLTVLGFSNAELDTMMRRMPAHLLGLE